jgi:hypothetical protein
VQPEILDIFLFRKVYIEEWCLLGCYAVWLLQEPQGVTSQKTILHSHRRENLKSYKVYVVYMDWRAGSSACCDCDMDSLAFILHLFNHFCIASRLDCNFCEAMPGSLSVANTAVSSANVAVVDSVEVGRSAVYNRYNVAPEHCPGEHQL